MKNDVPLSEKYRPQCFDDVVGQEKAVKTIKQVLSLGTPTAWWISGPSGVGKTTLARIIARSGRSDVKITEFDSADQLTPAVLKKMAPYWQQNAFFHDAVIINEAHGLQKPVVRILLGVLEKLRDGEQIIFTTTHEGEERLLECNLDAAPLLSRCHVIHLTKQGCADPFAARCQKIAKAEGLDGGQPIDAYRKLAQECKNNFRRMLMEIEGGCMLASVPQ